MITKSSTKALMRNTTNYIEEEESFDPKNWEHFRQLGYHIIEDTVSYLQNVRHRPIRKMMTESERKAICETVPMDESDESTVYEQFKTFILPYPLGNISPKFWGWVIGTGTPLGMYSELLSAAMNSSVGGGSHAANYVEYAVIEWFKKIFNYNPDASGLFLSGCSMANLIGLTIARNAKTEYDVRKVGLSSHSSPLRFYGSSEVHSSIIRAIEVLGIGSDNFNEIPCDDRFRIRIDYLEKAILEDIEKGYKPICIIGNLGSVNVGAIDPIMDLARIANQYGLWFHIDGAFGALVKFSPEFQPLANGLEQGHSLAFDLHKWMCLPYEVGCILVNDRKNHYETFASHPAYLPLREEQKDEPITYRDYGLELSRSFRALKVWFHFKTFGVKKIGRIIRQNIMQARYLAERIQEENRFELLAPVELNIVCFRYIHPEKNLNEINEINRRILEILKEKNLAILSSLTIKDVFWLRCSITNHRTSHLDIDELILGVRNNGNELSTNIRKTEM